MQTEQQADLIRTGASFARGKSKQDYATPWGFIRACEKTYGPITFDLAASAENSKAPADHFFDKEDDSLIQPWHTIPGILWLNPPFDRIAPWADKCFRESLLGAKIFFLTPASVGSNWFRDHVHRRAMVLALNGRITFEGAKDPYPKDCILSVYGIERPGFDVWDWQHTVRIY